jgi:UDP:flavonoid glycosyltransferase YjiC (YdhE family)
VKLLFSTRPAYGHVYPMAPLAIAARDAGHEVVFATTGRFVTRLRRLGFDVYDVGVTIEGARDALLASTTDAGGMATDLTGRPDIEFSARLFIDGVARATAADLRSLLPSLAPDAVVYGQYDFGAAVAAHAAGIPALCHSLSPRPPDVLTANATTTELMDRLWTDHGVDSAALDEHTGDAYLDLFPDRMQPTELHRDPRRLRLRPVPFVEPDARLPSWVATARRPLVYLTLGTVVATDAALAPVVEGLAQLDVEVLVTLGSADGHDLGSLPRNVHVEAFVDQPGVLRHAALAVHHGGSGTTLAALTSGVPQLLLPQGADQFWNADKLAGAGLAGVLEPAGATPEAIADAAAAELDRPRPAATRARGELLALPSPDEVITTLAHRYSTPRSTYLSG